MLVTLVCPNMKFVEVCGISAKNLVDYQQLSRPLNRTCRFERGKSKFRKTKASSLCKMYELRIYMSLG